MARGRGRAETSPKVTPRFCSLRSHGAFLSIVLFPTSEVQLCFKSPTEPEALPPPPPLLLLILLDTLMLLCRKKSSVVARIRKGSESQCQPQHLDRALENQIHLAFVSNPAVWARGIYYCRWLWVTRTRAMAWRSCEIAFFMIKYC